MSLSRFVIPVALAAVLGMLNSCSLMGGESSAEAAEGAAKKDKTGGYADYIANGGNVEATTYDVTSSEDLAKIDNGADGEVFFTNPDAPEEEVQGITEAFEQRRTQQHWLSNSAQASRMARREGLPLLVWFHDSTLSPISKDLGRELLKSPDFMAWTKERAICLCLDAGKGMNDVQASGEASTKSRKIRRMAQSYGLKRKPAFVVISPQGKVMTLIDGFDGYAGALEKQLKEGVEQAAKAYDAYKEGLKEKGFREWHSADGKKSFFAKVTRFDQEKDILYLKGPTGKQYKVNERKFHDLDVDYIENNLREGGPKY